MESNHNPYDYVASFARLDDILGQSDVSYEETDSLPSRERLTFSNGFYANCSALFVDIRDSSTLPAKYRRPRLARIYRAYISEVVAVMNADPKCCEINIVGDCVWSVIDTPKKVDIDRVFQSAFEINSLIQTFNHKLGKRDIDPVRVGIGMDWGRALMIKAGYSGSGINDVVYMGDVVNRAAKLAAKGSKGPVAQPLMAGADFYGNLKVENQALLHLTLDRECYQGNVISTVMEAWYKENCT